MDLPKHFYPPAYSILLNGSPFDFFKTGRGLGQGNPISPFLFINGSKVLSRLNLREEQRGNIKGIKRRGGPSIWHLICRQSHYFEQSNPKKCKSHTRYLEYFWKLVWLGVFGGIKFLQELHSLLGWLLKGRLNLLHRQLKETEFNSGELVLHVEEE